MRVLLDTHAFLWFGLNDARLSGEARRVIPRGSFTMVLLTQSLFLQTTIYKLSVDSDCCVISKRNF